MGMFGKRVLNQLAINFLGVDPMAGEAQKKRKEALQNAALAAAGLFNPVPGTVQPDKVFDAEGQDISTAFAPQMRQQPARRRTPEEIAAGLAGLTAGAPGFNPTPYRELAAFAKPNLMITPTGEAIDQYDPSNAGRVFPGLEHGQVLSSAGVKTLPGYAQSLGEIEGAKTGAQEGAKAQLDVIQLPMPDGSTQAIPRDVAVKLILQSMAGGQGGGAGGIGRSQTPGDRIAQEGAARTGVERAAAQPQQFSGLQDQARTTDLVISTIDKALPQIGNWTAGFGANLAGVKGLPAHDLQATLDTIRSNVGFEQLAKMRANSPTGGALGSVSERENALLQSVLGSLDAGQSPQQLAASLKQVRDQLAAIRQQRQQLYNNTYPTAPASGPRTQTPRARILSVE
jgi:hypothetical protein